MMCSVEMEGRRGRVLCLQPVARRIAYNHSNVRKKQIELLLSPLLEYYRYPRQCKEREP